MMSSSTVGTYRIPAIPKFPNVREVFIWRTMDLQSKCVR